MKIFIKNMVSIRCKMLVKEELKKLGIHYRSVELGAVEIIGELPPEKRNLLKINLGKSGLYLIDDKRIILIEQVKNVVVEMVHYLEEFPKIKNSQYIAERLKYDYTYLANLFSEVTGITIEHYIIMHKIERVKELLRYGELNLTQISYKLNYSSVAHLSSQFRKITGLSPSHFKRSKYQRRKALENV